MPKVFRLVDRQPVGKPAFVSAPQFTRNFMDLFTEGLLKCACQRRAFAARCVVASLSVETMCLCSGHSLLCPSVRLSCSRLYVSLCLVVSLCVSASLICADVNWSNVFAAGGSVAACLTHIPEKYDESNITRRDYFHNVAYAGSDVDLFLYGLTPVRVSLSLSLQCHSVDAGL
jgi:hypothetical protein